MISPAEIRKKAENKYPDLLKASLRGDTIFPLRIPANLQPAGSTPVERVQELTLLMKNSSGETGRPGYSIERSVVNTRGRGVQTLPHALLFATEEDFLHYIGKEEEYSRFRRDCDFILQHLPALMPWVNSQPKVIVKYSGSWPGLLEVCQYLLINPQPGVYVRQLPIKTDTKFIERHEAILRALLDQVLPEKTVNQEQEDFYERFGLLRDDTRIRFRLLDRTSAHLFSGLSDISVPVHELASLSIECDRVLVVENKTCFLSLPTLRNTIAIFGSGNAAVLLSKCKWLNSQPLIYWGDIDLHGFAILARLREHFPHVQSIMMDKATYDAHSQFAYDGQVCESIALEYLTEHEKELCYYLQQHPQANRIEQEKIENSEVVRALSQF